MEKEVFICYWEDLLYVEMSGQMVKLKQGTEQNTGLPLQIWS